MADQIDNPHRAPQAWVDALAESEADLAAGRVVPGEDVMRGLDEALARMAARGVPDDHSAPLGAKATARG